MRWLLLATVLLGGLGACTDEQAEDTGAADASICLNCTPPRKLLSLPQLENSLVTRQGRLFVSGQSNLYEIFRDGDSYRSDALHSNGCSGLAEDRGHLYALCAGALPTNPTGLYALSLADPAARPQLIFELQGMSLPNGMVAAQGALFLTDGPVAVEPKIVRLTLDSADPLVVLEQSTWLSSLPDYPNGLAWDGSALYTTFYQPGFGGQVSRMSLDAQGQFAERTDISPRGIMDDLIVTGSSLIVTDWQNSALFEVSLNGELLQETAPNTFAQPSSVVRAGPPLFDGPVLLITERYTGDGLWMIE